MFGLAIVGEAAAVMFIGFSVGMCFLGGDHEIFLASIYFCEECPLFHFAFLPAIRNSVFLTGFGALMFIIVFWFLVCLF